eukprot:jgi/Psemu1/43418/gm1.43418_g
MVVEDTDNPNCIVKLIFYHRDVCSPDQVQFFCHVNHSRRKTAKYVFKAKSPVGADTICKWVRDFAEVADFKDWETYYTPHDNRHRCCTILASDHAKSSHPYIHQNSKTQKTVQGVLCSGLHKEQQPEKKTEVNNNKNSSNNKPPIAPSTKKVIINVDQQDKENIPVPQDLAPAVVLGTKKLSPSKDTLKKEVQKQKKDSKELKKENKKQRTKLEDAEDNVAQLTIDLKESNNINKTLNLEDAKKIATKEAEDNFKLSKMEWRNEKGRMEADHRNQVALAETKIENEQRLRDIELKGKQNEIDQLHRHMNQNQCAIM